VSNKFCNLVVVSCPAQEAECEKASMDVKYNMDTKIEDNTRLYKLQKSQFDREINTAVRRPFLWPLIKSSREPLLLTDGHTAFASFVEIFAGEIRRF
jgi:hypothetical protein